jgi:hypothetical protein
MVSVRFYPFKKKNGYIPTISRRKFLKIRGAVVVASIASVSIYSFLFKRFWLDVHIVQLSFNQLPAAFSGTKIVHFSDLHLGTFFDVDHLHCPTAITCSFRKISILGNHDYRIG